MAGKERNKDDKGPAIDQQAAAEIQKGATSSGFKYIDIENLKRNLGIGSGTEEKDSKKKLLYGK